MKRNTLNQAIRTELQKLGVAFSEMQITRQYETKGRVLHRGLTQWQIHNLSLVPAVHSFPEITLVYDFVVFLGGHPARWIYSVPNIPELEADRIKISLLLNQHPHTAKSSIFVVPEKPYFLANRPAIVVVRPDEIVKCFED